jgi:signal transduction histidine kinase
MSNLVLNSTDAMPNGGDLVVSTGEIEEREVWLEVRDTGSGIPDDIRPHIFEPFFTTKGEDRGIGLGLAVVHGIVAAHGGRIDVESIPAAGRCASPTAAPVFVRRRCPPDHADHRPARAVLVVETRPAPARGWGDADHAGYRVR